MGALRACGFREHDRQEASGGLALSAELRCVEAVPHDSVHVRNSLATRALVRRSVSEELLQLLGVPQRGVCRAAPGHRLPGPRPRALCRGVSGGSGEGDCGSRSGRSRADRFGGALLGRIPGDVYPDPDRHFCSVGSWCAAHQFPQHDGRDPLAARSSGNGSLGDGSGTHGRAVLGGLRGPRPQLARRFR